MRFRLLGPVEVHTDDGQVLTLPRRQERCVLAILLLAECHPVPIDRLSDLLWDGDPPKQPQQAIRSSVSRIRALLAGAGEPPVSLVGNRTGYRLRCQPDSVDAHVFRRQVDQATNATDLDGRARLLREALTLWHGPALHNAAPPRLRQRLCADLEELRLYAVEESVATELDLGRDRQLLPELARLTGEHPLRERLVELRMRALHRNGRTSDALDTYTRWRPMLADQLGLAPSPRLQRLHQEILRGEPLLPSAATKPDQLPVDLPSASGHAGEFHRLDQLLAGADTTTGGPTIVIITGAAGVGKTMFATQWAHRVRDRFPDGQLCIDLRWYQSCGTGAIRPLLDALGVASQRIPTSQDGQVNLYRSLLADKRMLILLDDAGTAEQIRPLLPGAPGCLVVITSRNRLTSLVATNGAHSLILPPPSTVDNRASTASLIRAQRCGEEATVRAAARRLGNSQCEPELRVTCQCWCQRVVS